jgi:hypothetical protein
MPNFSVQLDIELIDHPYDRQVTKWLMPNVNNWEITAQSENRHLWGLEWVLFLFACSFRSL